MTTALIIMTNGEARGNPPNSALHRLVTALKSNDILQKKGITSIHCGVLSGEPSIANALKRAQGDAIDQILIYPLFMSKGYFFKTALPAQLAQSAINIPFTLLPPLCEDGNLPDVIYQHAIQTLQETNWAITETRLLIVGHGSTKNSASAQATFQQAQSLVSKSQFLGIETAFLEEEPIIGDLLQHTKELQTIIVGYFTGQGLHGKDDIAKAIQQSGAKAVYAGSVGAMPEIKNLILAALSAHLSLH